MRRPNFHEVKNVREFEYTFSKREYNFFAIWPEKSTIYEKPAVDLEKCGRV